MIRIGAMVSGGGTNLQAVLDAIDAGKIDGQVVTPDPDFPMINPGDLFSRILPFFFYCFI